MDSPDKNIFVQALLRRIERVEPIVFTLVIFSLIATLYVHKSAAFVFIISTSVMAMFNWIKATSIKVKPEEGIQSFCLKLLSFSLAIGFVALLFKTQNFPNSSLMVYTYVGAISVTLLIAVWKKVKLTELLTKLEWLQLVFLTSTCVLAVVKMFI
jgi:hypothetical protein